MKNLIKSIVNPLLLEINAFTLNFRDKTIEREFREEYKTKNATLASLFTIIGLFVVVIFYLIYDMEHTLWFKNMMIMLGLLGIVIHIKAFRKFQDISYILFSVVFVFSYTHRALLYSENDFENLSGHFMGLLIILFGVNTFLKLIFTQSTILNVIYFFTYEYYLYHSSHMYETNFNNFIFSTAILFSFLFFISMSNYFYEYITRDAFIKKKTIQNQTDELIEAKSNVEKRVSEQTQEINEEKIKNQKSILMGQQLERERIARDLHDGMNIKLIMLKRKLETYPDNTEILTEIDNVIEQIREISHDLFPYSLINFGLIKSIEDTCYNIQENSGIDIQFTRIGISENTRWDKTIEIEVFKIIQELITNCMKHAHAEKLLIDLIAEEETLFFTVEDDGIGFDINDNTETHFGLKNIEARIRILGGTISFDSVKEKGTTVMFKIPTNI